MNQEISEDRCCRWQQNITNTRLLPDCLRTWRIFFSPAMSTICGLLPTIGAPSVRPFTESDDTRSRNNTICLPEDEQRAARNMLRIVVQHTYCWRIKELCIKLVIWKSLYYDARSEKHQILYFSSKHFVSRCLSETINIKICNTVILPLLYMGVKIGLLHWRWTLNYGCSKTGCWARRIGICEGGCNKGTEKLIVGNLMICIPHQILFGWWIQKWDGRSMWHVWLRAAMLTGCSWKV